MSGPAPGTREGVLDGTSSRSGAGEELLSAECVGSAGRAPAPQGVPDPTATIVRDHVAPDGGGRRRDLRVLPANRRSGQIRFTFIESEGSGTAPKRERGDQAHTARFKKIGSSYFDQVATEAIDEAHFSSERPGRSGSPQLRLHWRGKHGACKLWRRKSNRASRTRLTRHPLLSRRKHRGSSAPALPLPISTPTAPPELNPGNRPSSPRHP